MALTWPNTYDIFNAIKNQCNYKKNIDFRKKQKKGEIRTMDWSVTNSIKAHDEIMHTKLNHM